MHHPRGGEQRGSSAWSRAKEREDLHRAAPCRDEDCASEYDPCPAGAESAGRQAAREDLPRPLLLAEGEELLRIWEKVTSG